MQRLYRSGFAGWNVKHFHAWYGREHGGTRSYSWVKNVLQQGQLVVRAKARGKHRLKRERRPLPGCVNAHGFSLHAAVRCGAHQRKELERLCRYITRPVIANERLKRNGAGQVVLQLKSPYRDGTTHIVMSPLEFMQRLAALVPLRGCI